MNKYKLSMITPDGHKDYYGIFNSKEMAEKTAKEFIVLFTTYNSYEISYTE